MSREWRRLTAPTLTMIGNARGSDLRNTAEEIIRFRMAMQSILPALKTDPPAPLVAVVFRDDNALTPFKPRYRGKPLDTVGAYFSPLPDVNYIVMAMGRREYTYRVIFREYTHLLVNQNFRRLPLWLNEGLADFYSTFDSSERDGRSMAGRPIPEHLRQLGELGTLVPMNQFINPQATNELYRDVQLTARFYAQSWLLTHYLLVGDNMKHRPQLAAFVNGLRTGEPPDLVFRRVFGADMGPLDRALRQYVRLLQLTAFVVPMPTPEVKLEQAVSNLTEAEAEQIQGDLLVRTGAFEDADKHLDKALALEHLHVDARLSRARSLIAQDRIADAIDMLGAADLVALNDFRTVFLRGEANRLGGHYDDAEKAYTRAIALRKDSAFAYYGMSITQLALGRPEAASTFERALMLQPGGGWYLSRLLESQRLGIDRFVQSDASRYVDMSGWTANTPYVVFIAALTHRRQRSTEKAAEVLEAIRWHVEPESWQAMVTAFLQDKLTAEGLLAKASPEGLLTEAHAYIGIKANIDGDRDTALKHLQWVKDKGRHDYTEYRLALGELARIDRASKADH